MTDEGWRCLVCDQTTSEGPLPVQHQKFQMYRKRENMGEVGKLASGMSLKSHGPPWHGYGFVQVKLKKGRERALGCKSHGPLWVWVGIQGLGVGILILKVLEIICSL